MTRRAIDLAWALLVAATGCGWSCCCSAQTWGTEPSLGARRVSFDGDWRFHRGDASHAERPETADAEWQRVRLPHDWAIDGPFDAALDPQTGALPVSGIGWYHKWFRLPTRAAGRYYSVEFDGAMSNSRVWLNGHEVGGRPYGYIGFSLDLTPFLAFGKQPNLLAVRLAPQAQASRWYPGAGIYRNVWLTQSGSVSVEHWGTYVTTPSVSPQSARVAVWTQLRNHLSKTTHVTVLSTLIDALGRPVSRHAQALELPARGVGTGASTLEVLQPHLWDVHDPYLYSLRTEVLRQGRVVDQYMTTVGIRTVAFDRNRGLFLNGRHLKLHGVCLHHDLGALGAAVNRRAIERQLQILQAAGVNAIRTSHNPPAPELLELADRLGFLVIDEAFDMWRTAKVPNGYSQYFESWSERDLRDMVRRDRNHPSIIMWSIGNEVPEQGQADGWQVARRLSRIVHEEDPTRPTTAAFDNVEGAIGNGLAAQVDIPGFNYKPLRYEEIRRAHPTWILYGSETASCVSSRGTYHLPIEKYDKHPSLQISSYDVIAPPWAYCPDVELAAQEADPALLGEFVWTGFDYLGEPTPYFGGQGDSSHDWPARSSYFGMVDLAGFPKDRYYLYQSVWTDKPMVHLLPHWNWAGHEGQTIPVMVYSNADEVELFLNGRSLGRKRVRSEPVALPVGANVSANLVFRSKYRLLWQVPFEAGSLQAVAFRAGAEVARDRVVSAGKPARISLHSDREITLADGDDLAFITARVEDGEGNLCPDADNLLHFSVTGVGRLEAVDNGNAATTEAFHASVRRVFHGLALLIVRPAPGQGGQINVTAQAADLVDGTLQLHTQSGDAR